MVRAWAIGEKGGGLLVAGTDATAGARIWTMTASVGEFTGSGWPPCVAAGILKSGAVS
jgi:hypothetical protein